MGDQDLGFLAILDVPLALSQRPLLEAREFERESERRGIHLFSQLDLARLHRSGVLIPMLEARRDVGLALREARRSDQPDWSLLNLPPPKHTPELQRAVQRRLVVPARSKGFRSPKQRRRQKGNHSYYTSDYLYSSYQLLLLPEVAEARQAMASMRGNSKVAQWSRDRLDGIRKRSEAFERVVRLLTALEPYYWPGVSGRIRMPVHYGPVEHWWVEKQRFDAPRFLEWIGWSATEIRSTAEELLHRAHSVDPLRRWLDVVRLVHPEQWDRLEGDALVAVDLRRSAEMMLRFYEDLVTAGAAEPLPDIPPLTSHPLNERLKPDRALLDGVLSDYGLSPHPSVLLVFEGETEVFVATQIMPLLGLSPRNPLLRIFALAGIDKDPDLLARYVRPSLRPFNQEAAEFETPPLRIMVVIDAEGRFRSAEARERRRKQWVRRYHAALPDEFRTDESLAELDQLVTLGTWTATGGDFELAHFAPSTLARALIETHRAPPGSTVESLTFEIIAAKAGGRGLRSVWKAWPDRAGIKMDLWRRLLPRLERRVKGASYERAVRTPMARILLAADDFRRHPRHGVLLRIRSNRPDSQ